MTVPKKLTLGMNPSEKTTRCNFTLTVRDQYKLSTSKDPIRRLQSFFAQPNYKQLPIDDNFTRRGLWWCSDIDRTLWSWSISWI